MPDLFSGKLIERRMRLIAIALAGLLIMIQFPLWLGKGGWLRTREMAKQLQVEQMKNVELKARNNKLESEVLDLKEGTGAVEERARYELGMIKDDEIFVQVVDANSPQLESNLPRSIPRSPVAGAAPAANDTLQATRVRALPSLPPRHTSQQTTTHTATKPNKPITQPN